MLKWHKWAGLFFTFFLFVFALSGVFLNHRRAIASTDIQRSLLPESYRYSNWNNGSVRGSISLTGDSVLIYGGNGIWLTDSGAGNFTPFNKGIKKGADNNITVRIVKTESGDVFAVTTFDIYRLENNEWRNLSHALNTRERLSDVEVRGDSVFLISRSHLYASGYPYESFERITVKTPENFDNRVSLFKTMWTLHSGELFGIAGKVFVDILGIFTIIFCVTGVIIIFFPGILKKRKRNGKDSSALRSILKTSFKWHNKPGIIFLFFLLVLCITGMFLRPPLLISIVTSKNQPIPLTIQTNKNCWFDKLRSIRYDDHDNSWILYTSDGFYKLDDLRQTPEKLTKVPPVSVMGLNVMTKTDSVTWVTGSYSGIYKWNRDTETITDYYTGEAVRRQRGGPSVMGNAVSGFSRDFAGDIAFGHKSGAIPGNILPEMPDEVRKGKMSLWHFSLEAHVSRIYTFLPGIILSFFIPLSGIFFLIILITGFEIYRRRRKKKRKRMETV